MDASMAEIMVWAASNIVDLWLQVGHWLPVVGRALLGIVSALAASKAGVIAAAVFYHGLFAEGLGLAHCLVVVGIAVVPRWLVLG